MTSPAAPAHSVHLLGRPRIDRPDGTVAMRGRKSWALLAYLLLVDRPPTRSHLAGLLFADADDPLRALRWGLSEVRRALAGGATIEGDPVTLRRDPGLIVDVDIVANGPWAHAVRMPGMGSELLEGLTVRGGASFESWLLAEQTRMAIASQRILHEAAADAARRGDHRRAIGYAARAVIMAPLDESSHAHLIGLYRLAGDDTAAQRQYDACGRMLETELGTLPGPAVTAALRHRLDQLVPAQERKQHRSPARAYSNVDHTSQLRIPFTAA
jgi:DNA-binding SARP family transcriptional activator